MAKVQREKALPHRILALLLELEETVRDPYRVMWERLGDAPSRGQALRVALGRLERSGELRRVERGDRVVYELTDGARSRMERYRFSKKRWDGKWRMVAFDIPEKQGRARRALRERLLDLGFVQFQESVWIAPFDVLPEVRRLRSDYRIARHVKLLTVEVVEDHDRLMRRFGLDQDKNKKR
jgi:DNA-binding transcriptional regulator PaaX